MPKVKKEDLTESKFIKLLDWTYEKSLNGGGIFGTVEELAEKYLKQSGTLREKAVSFKNWQIAKNTMNGVVTGFGGFVIMPVTLSANIASILYVQIRMISVIAHMGGYNVRDDNVKTLVYATLINSSLEETLKNTGIKISAKVSKKIIEQFSYEIINKINKTIGAKLVTKYGSKGLINLSRGIPFLGAAVSGSIDGYSTHKIGNIAIDNFINED